MVLTLVGGAIIGLMVRFLYKYIKGRQLKKKEQKELL